MTITSRLGMLAALLSLSALSAPAAQASSSSSDPMSGQATVEARLSRIAAAVRQQQPAGAGEPELLAAGFVNGRYGGAVRGPAGGGFVNGHRYYGGGSRGFVNGGGGFVNGAYGRGGFANAVPRGGVFRNW